MHGKSPSIVDFEVFERALAAVVDGARSLDEIEMGLKSQQGVESVQLAGYVLKSNPPQRDFIIEFRAADGSLVRKVVNISDLDDQFRFNKIRDV